MNARQRIFAEQYVRLGNATKAAVLAGYSEKTAQEQGSRLLSNVMVLEYIDTLMDEMSGICMAEAKEVLAYLTAVMRGTAKEESIIIINGKPARVLKPVSISARLKAAELIGKRLGMWTERKCLYPEEPVIIVNNIPRPEQENGIENSKNEIEIS